MSQTSVLVAGRYRLEGRQVVDLVVGLGDDDAVLAAGGQFGGGEDCAVGPVQPGPGIGAAQHGDLVPAARAARRSWRPTTGRAGPASRRAGQRWSRAGAGARMIMMPYG